MANEAKLQIVVDAVNNAGSTFAALGANLDAVSAKQANLRSGMLAVGAAGAAAFAGMALLTKGVIQAGADYEQTQIAFRTMIGDADKAQKTLNDLSKFAASTPFELPQLQTAAKQLLAYGISADHLIPTLKTLGDIAAGVGMDKLPQLVLAFGQVQAKGHLAGQELLQFTNAGVGLAQQLQKDLHLTRDEFEKLMASGGVSAEMVGNALNEMTSQGGLFFDLMDKQSHSLAGEWSNFKDQITLASIAIGTQLLPYLKPVVEKLTEIVQAFGQFAVAHPQLSAFILMATLGFTALLALLLPIALVLPGIVLMWTALAGVTLASVATFGVVIAILTLLGVAMMNIYKIITLVGSSWEDVWLGIKIIAAESANAVIGIVQGMINFVIDGVNSAINAINRVISAAQKVPGIGKYISQIGTIGAVTLGTFDTNTIAANDLAGRANPVSTPSNTVVVTGNTVLSQSVAEQIGDLIMSKLKLSNAI